MKFIAYFLILAVPAYAAVDGITCKAPGRYLDYSSPDCRGYIMCVATGVPGVYTDYKLNCPVGHTFNPEENMCTNTTNFHCLSKLPEFNCTTIGRFFNPSDPGCDTYIECFVQYDGALKSRIVSCPDPLNFDPVVRACVTKSLYSCVPETTTTVVPTKKPGKSAAPKVLRVDILSALFMSLVLFVCM